MQSGLKISGYFWGENGFSTVEERLNQTKDSTSSLAYFMKERAAIEEMYASKLQTLLKNTASLTEFGTTREAWFAIRGETENQCNTSKQLTQAILSECYTPLSKFKESQQKARRPYLTDAWKVNKENENLKQIFHKTREKYEKFHYETEKAQRMLEAAKARNDKTPKELLKMTGKVQKLSKETMTFEKESQEAANKLSAYQTFLSEKIAHVYDFLQKQEEERVEFIKMYLAKYVQLLEKHSEFLPQSCIRAKKKVDAVDKDEDIACFIREKQTGTERPKPSDIVFVPIRSTIQDVIQQHASSSDEFSLAAETSSTSSFDSIDQPAHTEQEQTFDVQIVGDVIKVIQKDEETGWWTGELNGRTGLFPSNYVEEV